MAQIINTDVTGLIYWDDGTVTDGNGNQIYTSVDPQGNVHWSDGIITDPSGNVIDSSYFVDKTAVPSVRATPYGYVNPAQQSSSDKSAYDPGITNTILSDTVGYVWQAATGTVDPWTKAKIAFDSGVGATSTAFDPTKYAQVNAQAVQNVTTVLKQDKADPSQALTGLQSSLAKFSSIALALGLAIFAVFIFVEVKK